MQEYNTSLETSSEDDLLEGSSSGDHFIFRFTVFEVSARVKGGQLVINQGMKTSVVELDAIRHLYYRELKARDLSELTIASMHRGKLKRVRIYADFKKRSSQSRGFHALVDYLRALHPHADISALTPELAYREMGSQNIPWIALPAVMALGVLLVALITSPLLIHGLDRGRTSFDLNALYQDEDAARAIRQMRSALSSRQVKFQGWIDVKHAWRRSEESASGIFQKPARSTAQSLDTSSSLTADRSLSDLKIVAPLYPHAPEESGVTPPVRVVVSAVGAQVESLLRNPLDQRYTGTLRDIFWEGIGEQARQRLTERGVVLHDEALLIEVGADHRDDLLVYLSFTGLLCLMTGLVFLYLKPPKSVRRLDS